MCLLIMIFFFLHVTAWKWPSQNLTHVLQYVIFHPFHPNCVGHQRVPEPMQDSALQSLFIFFRHKICKINCWLPVYFQQEQTPGVHWESLTPFSMFCLNNHRYHQKQKMHRHYVENYFSWLIQCYKFCCSTGTRWQIKCTGNLTGQLKEHMECFKNPNDETTLMVHYQIYWRMVELDSGLQYF